MSDDPQRISALDAFRTIDFAWRSGRPIVPLFGAGLSIEAGIPGTTHIAEYLAKVRFLAENPAQFSERVWLDFNAINREVIDRGREKGGTHDRTLLEEAIEQGLRDFPHNIASGSEPVRVESEIYELFGQ